MCTTLPVIVAVIGADPGVGEDCVIVSVKVVGPLQVAAHAPTTNVPMSPRVPDGLADTESAAPMKLMGKVPPLNDPEVV